MTRWKASGIHLMISIVVIGAVMIAVFALLYPEPYAQAAGADRLIFTLLGVDVVLGPLLTLIVFKAGKKSLKMDLTVIAGLQVVALFYGLYVISYARPVFTVFAADQFSLVSAQAVSDEDLALAALPEYSQRSWSGPLLAVAVPPTDSKEQNDLLFRAAVGGVDIDRQPKYFQNPADHRSTICQAGWTMNEAEVINDQLSAALESWHAEGNECRNCRVYPLSVITGLKSMVLNCETLQPMTILDASPGPG